MVRNSRSSTAINAHMPASAMENLVKNMGKRISVISRKDFRYEGTLMVADPQHSTATLGKVRFHGTESRCPGEGRVAPRDEIYDDIKIQLANVKDIFAHIIQCPEMADDSAVVECGTAVVPILWSAQELVAGSRFAVMNNVHTETLTTEASRSAGDSVTDVQAAEIFFGPFIATKNRVSFVSRSSIRYEGMLAQLDTEQHVVCLTGVRFFGTENRPAPKQVPAREETYPVVKFQLAELHDLRTYVPMCQEMLEDPAVIAVESSVGVMILFTKPVAEADPVQKGNGNDDAPKTGQLDITSSGGVRIRVPELPESLHTSILLALPAKFSTPRPQSAHTKQEDKKIPENGSRHRPKSSARSRLYATLPTMAGNSAFYPPAEVSPKKRGRKQRSDSMDVAEMRLETPQKVKRGRKRNTTAAQSPRSRHKRRLSVPPLTGGTIMVASGSSSQPEPPMSRDDALTSIAKEQIGGKFLNLVRSKFQSTYNAPKPMESTSEEPPKEEETDAMDPGVPAKPMNIRWSTALKRCPCPVEGCDYLAKSVFVLQQHFNRNHNDVHPKVELFLQCAECDDVGFKNRLPELKKHVEQVHGAAAEDVEEYNGKAVNTMDQSGAPSSYATDDETGSGDM